MTDTLTIRGALDLRPEDAIRAFRARDELVVTYSYRDLEPEEHARAFTVAKVTRLDLLTELGGSLDSALKEGKTFEMWKAGLGAELQSFRQGRLKTIFRTNMRVSRAAGQWARIQALKTSRPFLRYSAILDSRTRPAHAAWHGIILPVDHPFWRIIFPPNGWNCRCQVQQLSQADLDRRGWTVTPDADLPNLSPIGEAMFGGRIRNVIAGIDAGWDYNVGTESLAGVAIAALRSAGSAAGAGLQAAGQKMLAELLADKMMRPAIWRQATMRGNPAELARVAMADQGADVVRIAMQPPPPAAIAAIGEQLQIDVEGWRRLIRNYEIRKVVEKHARPAGGYYPGQVPLSFDDFALVPQILAQGEIVKVTKRGGAGRPSSIEWKARIGRFDYHLVEYVLTARQQLAFQSMWKVAAE